THTPPSVPTRRFPISPGLGSRQWAREYQEVKLLGAANSTVRTPAQTEIALFWTANPVATYFGAFGQLAADRHLSLSKSARLLARSEEHTSELQSRFDL